MRGRKSYELFDYMFGKQPQFLCSVEPKGNLKLSRADGDFWVCVLPRRLAEGQPCVEAPGGATPAAIQKRKALTSVEMVVISCREAAGGVPSCPQPAPTVSQEEIGTSHRKSPLEPGVEKLPSSLGPSFAICTGPVSL